MQDIINQCHPDADKTLAKLHTTCKILFWSQVQKLCHDNPPREFHFLL